MATSAGTAEPVEAQAAAPVDKKTIDLAELEAARIGHWSRSEGSGVAHLPTKPDESVMLRMKPQPRSEAIIAASASAEAGGSSSIEASGARASSRGEERHDYRQHASPAKPFRPLGDVEALIRSKWSLNESADMSQPENSTPLAETEPNGSAGIPAGRLWGPAVALPLPSAVAARVLDANASEDSAPLSQDEARCIEPDHVHREEEMADAALELAHHAQSDPPSEAAPDQDESEMMQVRAEDEKLIADADWTVPSSSSGPGMVGDDLGRIKGIGPATAQRLRELGVTRYAQIADWTPEDATWFGEQLFFPGRVERENWVERAKQLAAEQEGG